jgi:hypothetical protein
MRSAAGSSATPPRLARAAQLCVILALVAACACARTLPPEKAQASLYRDVQRLVTLRDAAGWQIDRFEIQAMLAETLMSVCRVPPDDRTALLAWLDMRIHALGGPIEAAYSARGNDLGAVEDLLELTRIRKTLETALAMADEDCPFWIDPSPRFAGRQISDDRWQLSTGGGGKAIATHQGSETDLRFGGAGRLLVGRNFGSRWAVYVGAEAGGNAGFPKNPDGDRSSLVLGLDLVAPVVARYTLVNSYLELEAGYVAHLTEEDWRDVDHGVHLGVGFGGRASRVRWFFPGAVFGISYEHIFENGAPMHTLKMGFRVALDLDL